MMSKGTEIVLVIPNLIADLKRLQDSGVNLSSTCPNLVKLLARANQSPRNHDSRMPQEALLFDLFGYPVQPETELPVAAITSLIDFPGYSGNWLRADPVYLHVDLTKLILFDAGQCALTTEESQQLIMTLNQAFNEEYTFASSGDGQRWYLSLTEENYLKKIQTCSPHKVLGQNIDPFLPHGTEKSTWHRLMTEVQMVLHQSPINQRRMLRKQKPINSVWFWGYGEIPKLEYQFWSKVWAADVLTLALAKLSRCPYENLPVRVEDIRFELQNGRYLIDLREKSQINQLLDEAQQVLMNIEKNWVGPLVHMLRSNNCRVLKLQTIAAQYELQNHQLWRFWRQFRL